ncbi:MAG: PEP/pyruvate-binding domain-containing protein [Desulfobacterales bacterium]|nr:PEP/pyruvate-binding domain-containing protein [Desulfobacterales bacterium]
MKVKSKALEVNLADYHVDVAIDEKYATLQEVLSQYYGLMEGLNTLLKELSHPYKNWRFIVIETRKYSLEYFHLIKKHPKGPAAAQLLIDIFFDAIDSEVEMNVKIDAIDNLQLFLQKVLKDSGSEIEIFLPPIDSAFSRISDLPDDIFALFARSYYQIDRLAETFLNCVPKSDGVFNTINRLLIKFYRVTYAYWLSERDPQAWFAGEMSERDQRSTYLPFFKSISHTQLVDWNQQLKQMMHHQRLDSDKTLKALLKLPGFNQIVEQYRHIPRHLLNKAGGNGRGRHLKLIFLFHIMSITGLSLIHRQTLRDINQTLGWIIENENYRDIQNLIEKTFSILKERASMYPATTLNCVLNMGQGVYKTDDIDLINFFIDSVIDLGFAAPNIQGVDNNWQIQVNKTHILNIRTWLELIKLDPKRSIRLLSALIIHLSLCGVFIKDIDLFPRDITQLLNSGIGPVYNLAKQLTRLFPVYFNDIGAEGRLRDISTRIDEISQRRDILIHYLRKQSHVESSNRIIDLMEAVLYFWQSRDKTRLEPYIPPAIYDQIETQGLFIDGVFQIMGHLKEKGIRNPNDLLAISEKNIAHWLETIKGVPALDRERVELAAAFYKILNQKYNFDLIELDAYLAQLRTEALPDLNRLELAFVEPDLHKRLFMLLEYMEKLQAVILSEETYEIRQDIYKKRHITIDIPSMYGSYHEMKFDCLGLTFRIESLVNVLFEQLIENIDLSLITKATFHQIYSLLRLFDRALKLDGISSKEFERQLEFLAHSLEVKGFTLTQYLDIFKGFAQAVKNMVNDYFNNIHGQNLTRIFAQTPLGTLLPKFLPSGETIDSENLQLRVSEIFFRDRIALSLGLQQLDLFLSRILSTLFQQSYKLPKDKLQRLLLYDPQNAITPIDSSLARLTGIIYLGNKGLNMVRLKSFGYPIPPGFIITTEVFRCREIIESYPPAEQNFKEKIIDNISALEKVTGKIFGDRQNPLLLSVRSGSSISQPGMMDTLLDVGNNEEITEGIAATSGNAWFAWDNYRRYLQCYGMAYGLKRDDFDAIINESKQRLGIPLKRDFTGKQMREVALTYKQLIQEAGIEVVEDPYEQLHLAIKGVLASWESSRAMAYRRIIGISEDWGTAVTVQAMVYGNISQQSGTGVVFTHNPRWSGDTLKLWGDFTIGNQGEDVVSGLVKTMPISIFQQEIEMRETDVTMETHFPEIYQALNDWAHDLIDERGWSPQEIEFTFEGSSPDDLYLLQTRDMAIRERKQVLTFDFEQDPQRLYLGHGVGVSGGAMSGRLVFTLKDIEEWRVMDPGANLILARNDTVPDDIREIHAADGLLTARGGLTSHAAVIAHRLGKTCVVSCTNLECNEKEKYCEFNQLKIKSGEHISIDGHEGPVYQGLIKVKETRKGAN